MVGKKKKDASASIGLAKQQVILKKQAIKGVPKLTRTSLPTRNENKHSVLHEDASTSSSSSSNEPRNLLILDATKPYSFEYTKFGVAHRVTVQQSADDKTWPGGALWDCGVILSKLLVYWTNGASVVSPPPPRRRTLMVSCSDHKVKKTATTNQRTTSTPCASGSECIANRISWKDSTVLELGCGVGLTGLVAASLGARHVILTDLQVVIDKVTQCNVGMNTIAPSQRCHKSNCSNNMKRTCDYRTTRSGSKVVAMPLYWGNATDEDRVSKVIRELHKSNQGKQHKNPLHEDVIIYPDWIFIGDVAYQQYPGAPSHFDALLSTAKRFVGSNTQVLLATRNRMPASQDLLNLFQSEWREIASMNAHEVDARLLAVGRKHNMTIHIYCNKEIE